MRSLHVKEVPGELYVYDVESHSGLPPYRVCLGERILNGRAHGVCQCPHFQAVCDPNLREHSKRVPYKLEAGRVVEGVTECKHIRAARQHWEHHVATILLAHINQEHEHKQTST